MNEKEQLEYLIEEGRRCNSSSERIEGALLGDKVIDNGVIKRLDSVEAKLKKLDKYFWMLIGMLSLGTIPLGTKILPIVKDWLK